MLERSRVRSALAVGGALVLVGVLWTARATLATAPLKGWTYTTPPRAKVFVTFKVSANGKRVINLGAGIAVKCKGGAGGFPSARPGSGAITSQGTFTVVLKLYPPGPAGRKSSGTDTVTGRFIAGGKATGTVRTHFNGQNSGSFCRGVTQSWGATGTA